MARGSAFGRSKGGQALGVPSGEPIVKMKVDWKQLPFRFVSVVTALFYFIPNSIYRFHDAVTKVHPSSQYQDVLAGVLGLVVAVMIVKQIREPEEHVTLMQLIALIIASYVVADAVIPHGQGVGIAVLQGFLLFDLLLLHPAREKLKEIW